MAKRIYVVNGNGKDCLVEAHSAAAALAHVARGTFDVYVASQQDLVNLLPVIKVEVAGKEKVSDF